MGFGFGLRLGLGRWQAASGSQAGPRITAPGALDLATFRIGSLHTVSPGLAVPTGGGAITYETRWRVGEVILLQAQYSPAPADDDVTVAAQWRAVETGGTNDGASFWQTVGAGTVRYPAPSLTASHSLTGRTLHITVDDLSEGSSAALTALWFSDQDVRAEATGSGPWEYVVASAGSPTEILWIVTATSSGGIATASGALTIPADVSAPIAAGAIADQIMSTGITIAPINVASDVSGTAPMTFTLAPFSDPLPAGLDLSANGLLSGSPNEVSHNNIVVRARNEYGSAETSFLLTTTDADGWNVAGRGLEIAVNARPDLLCPVLSEGVGAFNVEGFSDDGTTFLFLVQPDGEAQPTNGALYLATGAPQIVRGVMPGPRQVSLLRPATSIVTLDHGQPASQWTLTTKPEQITVHTAPTVPAPTAHGGTSQITISS